ncbi:hypothetical protein BH18GEM1_BH18GEM1_11090 [soil metagenome]
MMIRHVPDGSLNEYVESTLAPVDMEAVEQHLQSCAACRAEASRIRALLADLAALPAAVRPRHDLYPGIEERIGAPDIRDRPLWTRPYSLAAAAVALVVVTAVVTALLLRGDRPGSFADGSTLPADVRVIEAEYEQAIGELARALESRRSDFDPATIRLVEDNLRIIDDAIRESRTALDADPGNEILHELIFASYKQKIDLLQRATRPAEL